MAPKVENKFTKVKKIEKVKKNTFDDNDTQQSSGLWSYVTAAYNYFTGYKPPKKRKSSPNKELIEAERLKLLDLTSYIYTDKKLCKHKFKESLKSIYENAKTEFHKENRTKFVYYYELYLYEWNHPHKPIYFALLDENEYKNRDDDLHDLLKMGFKIFRKYN
jgi:hypothetical protein